jgi:phosphate transport system substrate-binding protein
VKGSDTEVNLVQLLAERHMASNKAVVISVTGGGSGTGIAAILNKTADIANSSRPIKSEEIQKAKSSGLDVKQVIFATDALSVIVHPSNGVKNLTLDQISKIYRGEVKNWSEVGGNSVAISLYGRQSNSGTFTFFRDAVVKADYSADMKSLNGNSQIVEAVAADVGAVGYVGVGYIVDSKTKKPIKTVKAIPVLGTTGKMAGKPVSPTDEKAVIAGDYPITRPLFQYFLQNDEEIIKFIKFELSAAGQKIIRAEGFYDINSQWKAENDKVLK